MDENWLSETEGEETAALVAGVGYRDEHRWIDGVHISIYDCPDCCLGGEEFDCNLCEFFAPETCQLLRDPYLMQDIRTIFDICRKRRAAELERKQMLIRAVRLELQAYGRPLHYAVLTRMVEDRYPKLQVSEHRVYKIMAHHPDVFERVAAGVYRCKKASKRRR